jgi:hypothetical protein
MWSFPACGVLRRRFMICVGLPRLASACPGFCHGVVSGYCSGPRQLQQRKVVTVAKGPEFSLSDRLHTRAIVSGRSPVTDVAYLCHNCGSVHEVESIRENLILDLQPAARYELSAHRGILHPLARFLRWRMTRGLARALWPKYSHQPRLAWRRGLVQRSAAPLSDRPVPCRPATSGSDARTDNAALAGTPWATASISVDISNAVPRQHHDRPA